MLSYSQRHLSVSIWHMSITSLSGLEKLGETLALTCATNWVGVRRHMLQIYCCNPRQKKISCPPPSVSYPSLEEDFLPPATY